MSLDAQIRGRTTNTSPVRIAKVAILCRAQCPAAINTIDYFARLGSAISLVVIEWAERTKLSSTEAAFRAAHEEFHRILSQRRGPHRGSGSGWLCSCLPPELRTFIKKVLGRAADSAMTVENCAHRHDIPVTRVERHSSAATKSILEKHGIDLVLLASSAWLIKEPLLSLEKTRIINVHPAYLPKHRSLDALLWSILEHDRIGHTAHFVDGGVDTGPLLLFEEVPPLPGDTLETLRERIDARKPNLFHAVVTGLADGSIVPTLQMQSEGTHHRPMTVVELLKAEEALQRRLEFTQLPQARENWPPARILSQP
jgi:folate-dependent phosphoribosylglycinamide formyltransferase PurN